MKHYHFLLTAQCPRRLPEQSRVKGLLKRKDWKRNIPKTDAILREWNPPASAIPLIDPSQIQRYTTSQKWRGLAVTNIEGKGRGVTATRIFQDGEVVCDYHGPVMTAKEGKAVHLSTNEEETGYMFFFVKKGKQLCIDAHAEACECHPGQQTFGRLINHSRSMANLRPKQFSLETNGKETDVILFLARKRIEVGEELLFDYGVHKKSFGREGMECPWL